MVLVLVTATVVTGEWRAVDALALEAAQALASPGLDLAASLVGLFGQAEVTAGIALGLAVARARRHPREAIVPLLIVATVVIEALLKTVVAQPPLPPERFRTVELLPSLHVPFAFSFPSGHVARATFLLRVANGIPTWVVVLGVVLMVVTRVYLAEHWLSDTIGGLVLGLGVANLARRVA